MYSDPQTDHTFFEKLNEHISTNASTFVGIFRKSDIERRDKSFKLIDTCSDFSVSIGSSSHSHLGCSNEFAIFTITEQKVVKHDQDRKHTNNLVITVKCQYKNYKGLLSTFSFQVAVDYDVTKQGYFHNASVNSNGTLLIIHSLTTCVICRVPTKLADGSFILDEKRVLPGTFQGIKVVELNEGCNIVKVNFSCKYPNIFCLATMESLDVASSGNYSFARPSKTNSFEIFDEDTEFYGVIRIFDVETSLDTPLLSMKLSEQMCRLGKKASDTRHTYEKKRLQTPGALVDLFWNDNDSSHIGSLTLFALSNYGIVFAYCPINVHTINDFNVKLKLVESSLDLINKGFIFYGNKTTVDTKSDVLHLLQSLYNYNEDAENNNFELFPIIMKLNIDKKKLISHNTSSCESFAILSTYPELKIIASTSYGNIQVFKSSSPLVPQTSRFFNPKTFRNLYYVDCSDVSENNYFKGDKISFIPISCSSCLLYSLYESFIVTLSNGLKLTQIMHNTKVGDFLYYSSQPVTTLRLGGKTTEYFLEAENRNLVILFPYYCYIRDYEILKYDSIIMRTMNVDFNIDRIDESDFIFRCPSIKLSAQDHIDSDSNHLSFINRQRTSKYTLSSYNDFSDSLRTLKVFIQNKTIFKQKIIEFIKTISNVDSNILESIKVQDNYGDIINKVQMVNEDIVNSADIYFGTYLQLYGSMFKDLKMRIDNIRNINQAIITRHEELIKLISRMRELRTMDNNILSVSNTITSVYLKHSSVLLENMVRQSNKSHAFDNESLQELIGDWLSSSTTRNICVMMNIFKRIQVLRSRLINIY